MCDLELRHQGIQRWKVILSSTKSFSRNIVLEMILRTRERCDQLAAEGFMVILPDYFRGNVPEECGPGDFACWGGEDRKKCSVFCFFVNAIMFSSSSQPWCRS